VFARGEAPPAVVVYVDAWTAYGGSQFVDSRGTGRYHSYLCEEVVPFVDARYRTLPGPAHRAIAGKSSGGFGAMITPMLRPDLFGALATHAGDTLYEYCYATEFPEAVRHLREYDGDIWKWWDDFRSRVAFTKKSDVALIGLLGVAAAFSAREDGTAELPFDPRSGVIRPGVWQQWLDWDPVRMVPRYADALRSQRDSYADFPRALAHYLRCNTVKADRHQQETDRRKNRDEHKHHATNPERFRDAILHPPHIEDGN